MNPKGSIEYDLEDAEVSSTYASAATPVLQHTTRNELSGVNQTSQYANGVSCTTVGETCTFDSRSGEMLQQQALVTPGGGSPFYAAHAYTYDAAGRETADTLTCGSAAPLQATRAYDTDNHIIAQNIPASFSSNNSCTTQSPNAPNPEALSYSWAADGRLANFATTQYTGGTPPSTTNTSAAHWDGNDLLYVSLEGVGLELYVEKLGWMMQASNGVWTMVVYDRDQSGTAVDRHAGNSGSTTAAFSQLTLDVVHLYGNANAACKGGIMSGIACSGVTTNPIAATAGGASCAVPPTTNQECASAPTTGNPILDASREDGYFDGTLSLQGVRAYDPNLNQWTTPDAYSGDAHDPMSQHPYMWNNNNPVQYSDPSGYVSTVSGDKEGDVTDVRIDVYIQFGGDADTKENENAYIGGLMSTWNNKNVTDMNGKTYHTSLNIHVVSGGTGAPAGQLNRVNITNNLAADTRPFGMMDRLNVRSNELSGFGPSHEFGHLMGMTDFYCAVKAGCMNGLSYGTPFSWATNDIMGVFNGQVTGNDMPICLRRMGRAHFHLVHNEEIVCEISARH